MVEHSTPIREVFPGTSLLSSIKLVEVQTLGKTVKHCVTLFKPTVCCHEVPSQHMKVKQAFIYDCGIQMLFTVDLGPSAGCELLPLETSDEWTLMKS